MSEYNIDIADMQCWVFPHGFSPSGKCLPAIALNFLRNTTFLDLFLNAMTSFI